MLDVAREDSRGRSNVAFQRIDVSRPLPFGDGTFDTITAILVINHIVDAGLLFAEVMRVLKQGGVFLFDDFATQLAKPVRFRSRRCCDGERS